MLSNFRNLFQFSLLTGLILYIFYPGVNENRPEVLNMSVFGQLEEYAMKNKLKILKSAEEIQAVFIASKDDSGDSLLSGIEFLPEDSIISVFSFLPALIEKKDFLSISLYLMELNSSFPSGNFVIDTSIRLIQFKSSLNLKYFNRNDSALLKELIYTIKMINNEAPGIFKEMGTPVADSNNCGEEEISYSSDNLEKALILTSLRENIRAI